MKKMVIWLCAWAILAVPAAVAQSNGTIKGAVKDTSGAILPGASVTLTNKATQRTQSMVTTEAGTYVFPALPPSQYGLAFDMPGFRKTIRDGVTLNVTETVVVDVSLEVGDMLQEVSVTADAPLVQTTTSSLGRVVEQIMVTGVPLSSRNFTQILALSPGVASEVPNAGAFGRNSVNISANGARPWENSVVFNGIVADNVNSLGFDDDNDKTGIPVPSPDAIQEFKVQTGLYDAENGRQGGANVNIVTKTGTNAIHGSLFEFFRNDALNANEFFRNRGGQPKGVLKQNQFGGTVGGPIAKDRTFFFLSYQGTRQRNGVSSASTRTTFLPVLGQDRSAAAIGAVYGGRAGQFGGVAVATNGANINPVALALLNAKLPSGEFAVPSPQTLLPNGSGFSSFSAVSRFKEDQIVANVDHTLNNKNRLTTKFFYATLPSDLPFQSSGSNVPGFGEIDKKSNLNVAISDTHAFSPTLLNEVRLGYSRNYMVQTPIEPFSASQMGIVPPVSDVDKLPLIQVSGLFTLGPQQNNQQTIILHTYEASDTLHVVKGAHDFRFGANVNPTQETRYLVYKTRGTLNFSSFPDFLLGMSGAQNGSDFSNVQQSSAANGINGRHPRFHNYAAFVQDDFRVSDRLSINMGLRWQYFGSEIDKRGRKGNFDLRQADFGILPPEGTLAGFVVPANADKNRIAKLTQTPPNYILPHKSLLDNDTKKAFSPRVGFAFRPVASKNDFVVRAGYGVYWSAIAGTVFEQESFDPWMITTTAGGAGANSTTFQNPWVPFPPATSELPVYIPLKPGANRSFLAIDPTTELPYTQQWSLNFQYGLGNYMFELAYAGSKSTHLIGSTRPNQALLASPERPIHDQTTNTTANASLRARTLEWLPNNLTMYGSYFDSNYHSLQLSVKRQYSRDLTFMAAYTWSHAIDNAGANGSGRNQPIGSFTGDFYNRAANKGTSDFDRKHRVVGSYVYTIPTIAENSAFARNVLGGWSLSGVTTIQTGRPFSILDSTAATIFAASSYAQFANGKTASDAQLTGPTQDRLNRYFDPTAFVNAPTIGNGTGFGNTGRNILRGPGQINFDMALMKEFRLPKVSEGSRLEFRSEFFNILNTPQFGNPGNQRGTSSSFGVVSNTVVAPRIIQFALKYQF
jgi:hypothetical protein